MVLPEVWQLLFKRKQIFEKRKIRVEQKYKLDSIAKVKMSKLKLHCLSHIKMYEKYVQVIDIIDYLRAKCKFIILHIIDQDCCSNNGFTQTTAPQHGRTTRNIVRDCYMLCFYMEFVCYLCFS